MGKLTTEQAKKIMEAVKNAETNPIDDKFYPESKITTADKIDSGPRKKMPSVTGRMPKIDRSFLNKDIKFEKPKPFNPKNVPGFKKPKPFNPNEMSEGKKYKYVGSSSIKKLKSGSKKKMPKARDMAMGNKNIVYLGDPYMVDGEMFDPVKADPKTYLRPKGAKTYNTGGDASCGCASCMGESSKGAGAAVRGTKFKGIF